MKKGTGDNNGLDRTGLSFPSQSYIFRGTYLMGKNRPNQKRTYRNKSQITRKMNGTPDNPASL